MHMILPGVRARRAVDQLLTQFFRADDGAAFRRAMTSLSRFYHLPTPRVDWYQYLDWGKTAGRTYENGRIHLVHPDYWKRGRKYHSERQWINTVYHEVGHYVLWSDPERKADGFAYRFVRGLNPQAAVPSRARRKRPTRSRPRRRRRRSRCR
jgi:hypothetical protein